MRRTGASRILPAMPMSTTERTRGRIMLLSALVRSRSLTPDMRSLVATQVAKVSPQGSKVLRATSSRLPPGVSRTFCPSSPPADRMAADSSGAPGRVMTSRPLPSKARVPPCPPTPTDCTKWAKAGLMRGCVISRAPRILSPPRSVKGTHAAMRHVPPSRTRPSQVFPWSTASRAGDPVFMYEPWPQKSAGVSREVETRTSRPSWS